MPTGKPGNTDTPGTRTRPRSLVQLLTDLPTQVQVLVRSELDLLKTEVIGKLKALGIGGGLLAGAGVILLFMIGVLLTSAVLALAQVMPGWLAALVIAAFLLVVAAIIALIGYRILKKGIPPIPSESIDSLQRDYRAIRGLGKRGHE